MPKLIKFVREWLPYLAIPVIVYFANIEFQSYLGRQALAEAKLPKRSLVEAKALSQENGKPLLVDVSAIWCSACRKLDQEVLAKPEVKALLEEKFVYVRLEYESETGRQFAERHGVEGFPTLLISDVEETQVRRLPHSYDPERFIATLTAL